jgi:hypothetical protein
MQKLISELTRLYLPAAAQLPAIWDQHLAGATTMTVSLVNEDGLTRAIPIAFNKAPDSEETAHWTLLCEVANALQTDLGLPAPAVSVSGSHGFVLWLSLDAAAPTAQVRSFVTLLGKVYSPARPLELSSIDGPAELPPCLNQRTGKWAAFINPGLGASFSEECALEMAPPLAGQAALLESVRSIGAQQFLHAMNLLQPSGAAEVTVPPSSPPAPAAPGLLLQDATLEDIVAHLHARNIEPTLRHLIKK